MGPFLPHWCEITSGQGDDGVSSDTMATFLYDLVGTVNHYGTLASGHYTSFVKVDKKWFHCNDAHVSDASEAEALNGNGAYLLFYVRRD